MYAVLVVCSDYLNHILFETLIQISTTFKFTKYNPEFKNQY